MYSLAPFFTYSPTISAKRCQATMLCHSVRSCHSSLRSLYFSLVARLNLAIGVPLGEYFTSGSLPTFPTRITLFTLLGIFATQIINVLSQAANAAEGKVLKLRGVNFAKDVCGSKARLPGQLISRGGRGVLDQAFRWRAPLRDSRSASIHPRR